VVRASEEHPVGEHGGTDLDGPVPLVLRRMPPQRHALAGSLTGHALDVPAGTWWELVDAAAADDAPPAAVALTRAGSDGSVSVCALGAGPADAPAALTELLRALTAVVRGHGADVVVVRLADPPDTAVRVALAEVGFTRAPGEDCSVLAL
jgi:hypothetical protein